MADSPTEGGGEETTLSVKEKDLILPIANITRLMKSVLPEGSKLAADANISVQDCVSEFILFITQEAAENAVNSNKKTISGDGIVPAFTSLGMRNYALVLNAFLARYREALATGKLNKRAAANTDDNPEGDENAPDNEAVGGEELAGRDE